MNEEHFIKAKALPIGEESWVGMIGLKRTIGGVVMMFYHEESDSVTAACFIPINSLKLTDKDN